MSLQLTILEQPSRPELVKALEQGKYQVLHYAGHSDVSHTGGDLFLVNRQTGLTDWLSGEDLAGLLVNNGIQLAVFNSCRGAYTPADDTQSGWREQNLVQALVNRGVPGVIAMAERIPDQVAITFTQLFYRNLRQGYPIDLCLSRVRQGLISAYRSNQPSWMLPILYLRPDFNGYLYAANIPAPDLLDTLETNSQLSTTALVPPDYSTDPDIAGLAQEVFARHEAASKSSPPGPWRQKCRIT
ncbi:MAG: CHAT domain-containing protein [Leptolyngbyaceae cyanobacterium SM2_3_12]|nr:CHAT domain-containing protein [Leptolyngbyaceae cyanobacterium SM2_3_12]